MIAAHDFPASDPHPRLKLLAFKKSRSAQASIFQLCRIRRTKPGNSSWVEWPVVIPSWFRDRLLRDRDRDYVSSRFKVATWTTRSHAPASRCARCVLSTAYSQMIIGKLLKIDCHIIAEIHK